MITGVAVVPSTPLLLPDAPGRRHPDTVALSAAAGRAVTALQDVEVAVVLAGGDQWGLANPPATGLTGYGLDLSPVTLAAVPDEVVAPLAGLVDQGWAPDVGVLARWLPAGTHTIGLAVPQAAALGGVSAGSATDVAARHTAATTATAVAQAILAIAAAHRVGLLVAGDLGAGHGPKPPRPQAATASALLDQQVVAALDNGRPGDLIRLQPRMVVDSASRAAGALTILGHLLSAARISTVVRASGAPHGVGYVVAQGG